MPLCRPILRPLHLAVASLPPLSLLLLPRAVLLLLLLQWARGRLEGRWGAAARLDTSRVSCRPAAPCSTRPRRPFRRAMPCNHHLHVKLAGVHFYRVGGPRYTVHMVPVGTAPALGPRRPPARRTPAGGPRGPGPPAPSAPPPASRRLAAPYVCKPGNHSTFRAAMNDPPANPFGAEAARAGQGRVRPGRDDKLPPGRLNSPAQRRLRNSACAPRSIEARVILTPDANLRPDSAVAGMSRKGGGGRTQSVFADKSTPLGRCKCSRNPLLAPGNRHKGTLVIIQSRQLQGQLRCSL